MTRSFKAAIIKGLREGQGVEDIALDLAMCPDQVRETVAELRRDGILPGVYNQARSDWRSIGALTEQLVKRQVQP